MRFVFLTATASENRSSVHKKMSWYKKHPFVFLCVVLSSECKVIVNCLMLLQSLLFICCLVYCMFAQCENSLRGHFGEKYFNMLGIVIIRWYARIC